MVYSFLPQWIQKVPSPLISILLLFSTMWIASALKKRFFPSNELQFSQAENREYVRGVANEVVRSGLTPYGDMLESVEDVALESNIDRREAKELLDCEIALLISEQKNWPEVTDVDRLRLAFKSLQRKGFYTDFGEICCASCGAADAKVAMKKNPNMLGYVFFTSQDVDAALAGEPIYFWYGTRTRKYVKSVYLKVAGELFESLKKQDLNPIWDKTSKDQIRLPIKWRIRWDPIHAEVS